MIRAPLVIAEARRWIGTPYQHQARCLGAGVDCAGLVIGVGHALGLLDVDYRDYGQLPHQGLLRRLCDQHLQRLDAAEPGCILLMGWVAEPGQEQHLGILTDADTLVHAYAQAGGCVEHRYSSAWQARTRQCYRYVGVV